MRRWFTNDPDDDGDGDELMDPQEAQDSLALSDKAFKAAILAGELRRVKHGDKEYVLRHDVQKLADESNPTVLASRVPRL